MALSTAVVLQGSSPTTVEATDSLHFANGTFGGAITVNSYNDSTHIRSSVGADDSNGNSPKNSKYLTSSTVDIGAGSVSLSSVSTANCPIKITITESVNITISGASIYAYDGTTDANAPTGITCQMAEQGDSTWTQAHGSGSALALGDKSTPATSQDYYLLMSVAPTSIGVKSGNKIKMVFTYQ